MATPAPAVCGHRHPRTTSPIGRRVVGRRDGVSAPTRWAASSPDTSTIGTPTPGTVPLPANTRPGARRLDVRRAERPGLQEAVRQGERRAALHPLGLPVERIDEVLDLHLAAGSRTARPWPATGCAPHRALVDQSIRPSRLGTGSSTNSTCRSGGAMRRLVDRRHGDEHRRIGHLLAVAQQGAERARPLLAEVDVVMGGAGGQVAGDAGVPHDGARRVVATARPARRVHARQQRAVGHRQIGGAHHGVGADHLAGRPGARRAPGPLVPLASTIRSTRSP